jgi:methylated-DNA-[protein]-cysteine S-methyltransferase
MATPSSSAPTPSFIRRVDSPIGRIEMTSENDLLTSLSIEREGRLPWHDQPERSNKVLDRAARQLAEYFAGKRTQFDLPVAAQGTEFQKAVWTELSRLRFGEVTSYGAIGEATGRATAGRAVGGAIGANPIPIIVPCHRVLGSDHRVTGYSGGDGISTKRWLLDHEGISYAA